MGQLVFQAALGGQVNLVGPNTASTFNLNVPAASDTLVARATTDTLTNKTLTSPVISGGTIDNAVIGGTTAVAGSFTTLTTSSTTTLSGGTANGVAYLNGSKALTTGTAFVFDGTNVGIGTSSPAGGGVKLDVQNATYSAIRTLSTTNSVDTRLQSYDTNSVGYVGTISNHPFLLYTNNTEQMRITAAGNVGIGTASPLGRLQISGATPSVLTGGYGQLNVFSTDAIGADKGGKISFGGVSGASGFDPYGFCAIAGLKDNATASNFSGYLTFSTSTSGGTVTERMRIDSSGNLLVGGTTVRDTCKFTLDTSNNGIEVYVVPNTNACDFAIFRANSGTLCGNISRVGTTAAVTYANTSDYRLKNVIGNVTGHGERIDALKPIHYKWKDDGSSASGFLAHEFQEVYASSVTGTKDAIDADGNPVYQSMQASTSEVIADLVAEIQSLRTRLTALEQK